MMADLLPLMQQWAALQPSCCKSQELGAQTEFCFFYVFLARDESQVIAHHELYPLAMEPEDWGLLQQALQQAIAAYGSRLRLENSGDGWHATIASPNRSRIACILVQDKQPALAILRAWVSHLEVQEGATP